MPSETRKRNSGRARKKMARPLPLLFFCPLMEIQVSHQVGKDIRLLVKHLVNRVGFFLEVEPPELFRMKKPRQIEGLNEHTGRVPPIPEAQGVMDATPLYRPDGAEPLVPQYSLDRHLPFAGKETPLDQDDIGVPFEDLLHGDDRPDCSEAGRKQ